MKIVSPLQAGVLQKPFSFHGRHFLCISLLWGFRLDTGAPVLETELWEALSELFNDGRVFDQSMPKAHAELLVLGSFYAPGGRPVTEGAVMVRVGALEKRLLVTGDRRWTALGTATSPEPMTHMPIRYSNAFGGAGYDANPIGKGFAPVTVDGEDIHPLPNIEYPHQALTSRGQRPAPASLEATDITWPMRQAWAGTYDEAYIRTRMPGLPDDVDWRVFNEAAQDQWFADFLRGDEPFEIVNMHPERPRIAGKLPAVRGRAFVQQVRPDIGDPQFREVSTRLDTVWLCPDALLGVVIHRGQIEIAEDDAADIKSLMIAYEGLSDPPRSVEHYRSEMEKRTDPEEGHRYLLNTTALLPIGCPCAFQAMIEGSDGLKMEGLGQQNATRYAERQEAMAKERLDAELERNTRELEQQLPPEAGEPVDLSALMRERKAELGEEEKQLRALLEQAVPAGDGPGGIDLMAVDFGKLDELTELIRQQGEQRREEALAQMQAELERIREDAEQTPQEREKALQAIDDVLAKLKAPPPLPRFHFDELLEHMRQEVREVERQCAELEAQGIDTTPLRQQLPDLAAVEERLATAERTARESYRDSAHMMEHGVSPHPGKEPELAALLLGAAASGAKVAGGDFAYVDLRGATLSNLDLSDALLEYADLTDAHLIDVDLSRAVLAHAKLDGCRLERVRLTGANLGATSLRGTQFHDCELTEATLSRAHIAGASFHGCRFGERMDCFLETKIEGADFSRSFLAEVNFLQLDFRGSRFRGTDLSRASFIDCRLEGADFTEAVLTGANLVNSPARDAVFDRAQMSNVRFVGEPELTGASFRHAQIDGANLREARLDRATFDGADLYMSDFGGSSLEGASLREVRAVQAQFIKANLSAVQAQGADLREVSLRKARLVGVDFSRANLFSVSFIDATLGNTRFDGANLDRTLLQDWRP